MNRQQTIAFLRLFLPVALLTLIGMEYLHDWAMALLLLTLFGGTALLLIRSTAQEQGVQQRFRTYFERAMVGMATTSVDQRWLAVNPALCAIFGYSEEELCRKTWAELTHPDDLAANQARFEAVLRGEYDGYEMEKRFIRRDGQIIDVFMAAQAIRKADGNVDYFISIIEDITRRKQAEEAHRLSEERLRQLGNNLPDSYLFQFTRQADGTPHFLYVSEGVERIHGISPADVLRDATTLHGLTHPDQVPSLIAAEQESQRTLQDFAQELHVRLANGDWGWILIRSRPRKMADDQVVWDGLATDISAQRRNENLLDLQSRRANALLALPGLAETLDEKAFMQQALHMAEDLTGSSISFMHFVNDDNESIELVAWSKKTLAEYCTAAFDCHYPLTKAGIWADAARQKKTIVINDYANAPDKRGLPAGHAKLERLVSVPVLDGEQVRMMTGLGNKTSDYTDTDIETIQLLGNDVWRIVTKRRADQALRIATQVVNASAVVCFRWRAEGNWPIEFVSDNVIQWGYTPEEMLAARTTFAETVHPDDLARIIEEVNGYTTVGMNTFVQEYRLLTGEGEVIWVVDRTKVVRDAAGEIQFFDCVLTDITARKLQEQKLADNLAAQRLLNKRLEEANNQLLQSEKMASIGQLAAGIAHELNNPIGFVHSNLGTLDGYLRDLMDLIDAYDQASRQADVPSERFRAIEQLKEERDIAYVRQDIGQLLAESRDGLARVRKIVQDLKNFSRVGEQEWQIADLHQGLDSTLNIVWNELKYKCKVNKEYGDIPPIHCLISQLNQVFMNLLVNAGHAIETKGEITIRTARHGTDEVMVEIRDTGKGIAPENLTRIFDPFFTTKPVGKGTGLGLSLSYGIVQRHHGRIEVESEVDRGSCFRVILPIQPSAARPPTTTENAA